MTSTSRPNILLIMVDQLSPFYLRAYGHPVVRTPNIDALWARSTVFDNAYCNYPVCAPSRASMLSGRLSSRIGAYDNGAEFPSSVPTICHYLRKLGYHTCLSGKMHFVGADQLHGFEERLTTDIYPSDFGWTANWRAGTDECPESPTGINMRSVVEAGVCRRSMQIDFDDDVAAQAVQKLFDLARAPEKTPFFLTVSFTHPHNPFVATQEYWDRYADAEIDMPKVGPTPYAQLDDHSRRLFYMFKLNEYRITEERVRAARRAYYAMVSYVDDKIGNVLDALRNSDFADNTVIIFTADHGEMLGERGFWYKSSFFEGSVRVPLIISRPIDNGTRRSKNVVSLVDLFPTILDFASDQKPPPLMAPIDGQSLVPLLNANSASWPDIALAEYTAEGAIAPIMMIRKGPHKFIFSETDRPQLYDVVHDPFELTNLFGTENVREVEEEMMDVLRRNWNPAEYRERVLADQKRRLFLHDVLMSGTVHPWDFQPYKDASKQYVRGGAKTTLVKGKARFPYVAPMPPDSPRKTS